MKKYSLFEYTFSNITILLVVFAFFLGFTPIMKAQNFTTGCIPETPATYKKIERLTFYSGQKTDQLPYKKDLTEHIVLPVREQGKIPMCVSMSITNAIALMEAIEKKTTQVGEVEMPSAWYLHQQLSQKSNKDCFSGMSISSAMNHLKNQGTFPEKGIERLSDCNGRVVTTTNAYQIEDYYRLFDAKAHPKYKIHQIRSSLAAGKPVIFSLPIHTGFTQLNEENNWTYQPKGSTEEMDMGMHAMTVVGFNGDKKAFKVINSWGTHWGDGGYGWLPYDYVGENCPHAFQLVLGERLQNAKQLSGTFNIKKPVDKRVVDEEKGITQPIFKVLPVDFKGTHYMTQQPIGLFEDFLLTIENVRGYLYAFSFDPGGDLKIHYPDLIADVCPGSTPTSITAPLIPDANSEIAIPKYDQSRLYYLADGTPVVTNPDLLRQVKEGKDYLCVLYCDQAIKKERLFEMLCHLEARADSDTFLMHFNEVFKDYLVPRENIIYHPTEMSFIANYTEGSVMPIILLIED